MKNVSIFIHAAILDNCADRIYQYLKLIDTSGLLIKTTNIFICFVGDKNIPLDNKIFDIYNKHNMITCLKVSENLKDYELPTLQFLYNFCIKNQDHNILYLHTKNVGKQINLCIEDQIEYMLYFLINKWKNNIEILKDYDTCGVDLRKEPVVHYSGNFWWSKASHIVKLPPPNEFNNISLYPNPLNSVRHNQEFWICYNNCLSKHFSMWDCNISVYERHLHRYESFNYI